MIMRGIRLTAVVLIASVGALSWPGVAWCTAFVFDTTNATFKGLPDSSSPLPPTLPHDIVSFQAITPGASRDFGGLLVTANAGIQATFVGSLAGANTDFVLGPTGFNNFTSTPGETVLFTNPGGFVDLRFLTDNLGGSFIDNFTGSAGTTLVELAFSDIRTDPNARSVFAFFGDGGGNLHDMVVRLDIVFSVPEPTTLSLLGAGLLGFGLVRRRRQV